MTAGALALFIGPEHVLQHASDAWSTTTNLPSAEQLRRFVAQVYASGSGIQLAELTSHPTRPGLEARCVATLDPVHGCFGMVTGVLVTCTDVPGELHSEDARRCGDLKPPSTGAMTEPVAIEARLRRPDGQWRWHRLALENQWLVAMDIDDARRADLKRNHYLSVVSHELRTPLMSMTLWESVLGDPSADAHLRSRAIEAIRDGVAAQSRILGDMLDVSHALSHKLFVSHSIVEVEPLLRDAVTNVANDADAKHITIRQEVTSLGQVRGDARRLRQIFDHLLSNAVKFTDHHGTVTVAARRETAQIVIEIADTGCGISPVDLPHIFEPFSQMSEVHRHGGVGVGLAMSDHLARLQHGSLRAQSPGLGQGSTFTFTMPSVDPSEAQRTATTAALSLARVLVVDDDVHVRNALTRLLTHAGAQVECVDSVAAARLTIEARSPSIVVCDIAMRHEDGHQFVRWLRSLHGSERSLPVIALSAHDQRSDVERAYDAGFDVYLVKPINFETLVTNIETLLEHARE